MVLLCCKINANSNHFPDGENSALPGTATLYWGIPPPLFTFHIVHSSLFSYSRNRLNHCSQGAVKCGRVLIDNREAGRVQGDSLTVEENT
jgi:hypothetical protein